VTTGAVPHDDDGKATTRYRHRTFFVGSEMRAAVKQGVAEYVPISIAHLPRLIEIGRIPIDVALIHAKQRGIRGFVAEVLSGNQRMVKLARNSPSRSGRGLG
jgi:acyl-CoA hydrolase